MKTEDPIPQQHMGDQLDVEQDIELSTQRQAHSTFVEAAHRFLNINQWQERSGQLSAAFQLTDKVGAELYRPAHVGDFIRINLPAPGTATGEGYDWVQIQSIDDKPDPTNEYEMFAIRVRPVASPLNQEPDVAHFFADAATSTFMVERKHLRVIASVHGRNEVPNKDVDRTTDRIRNTLVANAAKSGVAAIQWKSLVSGILKDL
jgi:hypothetical protein